MKTIIIAGGTPPTKKLITKETAKNTLIIAADSGANCLWQYKITPDYLIGDLDSINYQALNFCLNKDVIIEHYPSDKNFTDAELALKKAVKLGVKKIIFLGCLGGKRVDHLLGALGLLDECAKLNIEATLKDDYQTITLLKKSTIIHGKVGQRFSLQAYGEIVKHLSINGSKYTLKNHSLKMGNALTIANEFRKKKVKIKFSTGKLLMILGNYGAK
jgi:thiamine pyrophosphokinase